MNIKVANPSEIPQSWYNQVIGLDIETTDKYVWSDICMMSLYNPNEGTILVIPIKVFNYGLPQTIDPTELNTLKEFLKTIRVCGANIQFDLSCILFHWGVECKVYLDTFVIACLFQENVHSLKDMAMRIKPELRDELRHFSDIQDTKNPPFQYNIDDPQVVKYSALDAYLPFLIIKWYGFKLKKYEKIIKLEMDYLWTAYHERAYGLRFDLGLFYKKIEDAQAEIDQKQAELNKILGYELNPGSTKQKLDLLESMGVDSPFKTNKGNLSTSKESLQRIIDNLEEELYA